VRIGAARVSHGNGWIDPPIFGDSGWPAQHRREGLPPGIDFLGPKASLRGVRFTR
jgi:hypothetical protein